MAFFKSRCRLGLTVRRSNGKSGIYNWFEKGRNSSILWPIPTIPSGKGRLAVCPSNSALLSVVCARGASIRAIGRAKQNVMP